MSGRMEGDNHERYSGLFSGVGLLKGYELTLHDIDDTVKPVCSSAYASNSVRVAGEGLRTRSLMNYWSWK